ncbi:MAG: response regulator transcription factor [Clostridia bacterium]|nr:response regulator transcription factor [Clostridia bacterium]
MIYLLEDDESIRKLVIYALVNQGFEAEGFGAPSAFRAAVKNKLPELVILDIMLPEEDGITVLKKLRRDPATASLPIVMLTAKNAEFNRVEGLDSGADDYISKPFGMMEFIARIRALLRRSGDRAPVREYAIGPLLISPDRREVKVAGEPVTLTYKEFSLLLILAENAGNVLTRRVLLERVWDLDDDCENRTLDVHVRTLRAKLGEAGALIETVRGVGYRLRKGD